jgi:polyphenol oxidase
VLKVPALEAVPGVVHGFSTSDEGSVGLKVPDPTVPLAARKRFAESLRVEFDELTVIGSVHGADVARVDGPMRKVDDVDALVTDKRGVALFATFADCYPILLVDPRRNCIALAHAGWRGTAVGVTTAVVEALVREYGSQPGELIAAIGPGICGKCYEVGGEVAERFASEFVSGSGGGKFLLDLTAANRAQLMAAGVTTIHAMGMCTKESDRLPSHRRQPDGTRFGALIALR